MFFTDTPEQIASDIADVRAMYAEHSDTDTMPTAEDIAEMYAWATRASTTVSLAKGVREVTSFTALDAAFDIYMRRANALIDRAYDTGVVGYARSAASTLDLAARYVRDDMTRRELLAGQREAETLTARLTRRAFYAKRGI